jgi:hypothetical protein
MDITSALSRVEAVVNQYHAFIEIKEALEAAVQAERIVVECGLREATLRESIAALEHQEAALSDHLDDMAVARTLEAMEAVAAKRAEYDGLAIECAKANELLHRTFNEIEAARLNWQAKVEVNVAELDRLRAAASAEVARYEAAKKAVEDIKALL